MMTGEEYIESLREMKTVVYYRGQRIENFVDHLALRPHIEGAAVTYRMAHDPRFEELATATSHLTGKKINRFTHIHRSPEDLVKKVKLLRAIGQRTGSCFQRCVGWDALNALYGITHEIDGRKGTSYHQRFVEYLKHIQDTDRMPDGAVTDPKGDRSLGASKQADPDQYVRVVERREDGIVVRGAKLHQTGAVNSHEIIVIPTVALRPDDGDYAVAFAVAMVSGARSNSSRYLCGICSAILCLLRSFHVVATRRRASLTSAGWSRFWVSIRAIAVRRPLRSAPFWHLLGEGARLREGPEQKICLKADLRDGGCWAAVRASCTRRLVEISFNPTCCSW